jgi:integrase
LPTSRTESVSVTSEHFSKRKRPNAYEAKIRVDVGSGTHLSIDSDRTIATAAEDWIKRVEANGMKGEGPAERTTIRQDRQHINLHIVPRIGKLRLAKLMKKDIENFRDGLLKRNGEHKALSRAFAKVLTSLKSMLKAGGCGHIADSCRPLRAASSPSPRER